MNSPVYKTAISFLLVAILLSACGTNNLWGSYEFTPTSSPGSTVTGTPLSTGTSTQAPTSTSSPLPALPTVSVTADPSPTATATRFLTTSAPGSTVAYTSQSGDSLKVVAAHFGVNVSEITSPVPLPASGFLNPGTPLFLPANQTPVPASPSQRILPDSELVNSPTTVGFNVQAYVDTAGGKLSTFQEYMATVGMLSGAEGVWRISIGSSISPRLLLALIQYYTGWVTGQPKPDLDEQYLFGYKNISYDPANPSLYQPMRLVIQDLLSGYYGWRAGKLTELTFPDGQTLRIAPDLNAGSVALQYFFSKHYNYDDWLQAIDPETGFLSLYKSMFGDPWERTLELGPLFPDDLAQPPLILPFDVGRVWSFTSGPHPAWEKETALAAVDFGPSDTSSCSEQSSAWVTAVAPGLIVRSESSYVVLDLDRDGYEQTGWVVLYQHIATQDRVRAGATVDAGDHIGHPSCEGGFATNINVHIARKYNGEWVAAGDPLPLVMGGWTVHAGSSEREGTMTRGDQTVTASMVGASVSWITRQPGE